MKLNNKTYNILKWVSLVALDAIGVAYKNLAIVWNLPYGEQIMDTCVILSVLIGTLIGISSYSYAKAKEVATEDIVLEEE